MTKKKTTKSKKGVPLKCKRCKKFKRDCNCGRPTKKSDEAVKKLEQALRQDFTVDQACVYAGITNKTFYNWCNEDDEFLRKMNAARQYMNEKAKKTLQNMVDMGHPGASMWFLERRESNRYSKKEVHEVAETTTDKLDEGRKDELDKLIDANL